MKNERAPHINVDADNLLKKYSDEVADLLDFKKNTNLSEHTKNAIETAIKRILEGNESAAKSILSMKLNVYKNDPKLHEYIPEFEKIIESTLENTNEYKKSYDKDLANIREAELNKKQNEEKLRKEKENQEKIEDENKKKAKREEKLKRQLESQARLKNLAEEDKKDHNPTIESITTPPDIKMEYKGEKTEEKPVETKEAEKTINSIELVVGDIMESAGLVNKINRYLKVSPPEKMYKVVHIEPWKNKKGEQRYKVFLKGEGEKVQINRETLIKMIEDSQKIPKYTFLSKGDTVLVNGKRYEILNATQKSIKYKEEGADIPVNIERAKMEDLLSKNKYEIIKKEKISKKTKGVASEDKKEEVITEEEVKIKEETKVEPEIIKKDLDTMEKETKKETDPRQAEADMLWHEGKYDEAKKLQNEIDGKEHKEAEKKEESHEEKKTTTESKDNHTEKEHKEAAKAEKVEEVKKDIIEKLKLDTKSKSPLWAKNLGTSGLKVSDLENVPEFVKLSTGEQLLVLEEINQRNARKMEELTKDRVAESYAKKNVFMKLFHGLSKNFQKASAEKAIAGQIKNGEHKVNLSTIKEISARIKELGLSVNEQTGEVMFLKSQQEGIGQYLTPAQIKAYNDIANKYTKLPTDWQNEKTANKYKLNPFKNNEYKEFQRIDSQYNAVRNAIMEHLENNYIANGGGTREARLHVQKLMSDTELGFDYLNYSRKYPEAAALLENSATQNQYKKLLTGDITTFLGGAGIGMAFKAAGGILGGTAFGGIKGFLSGKKNIKEQYKNDQIDLTHQEAKEIGATKKESIDRFINADDQVDKISRLISKMEKAETPEEKLMLAQRLKTRLDYINEKKYAGFINRGKNDDIALNFKFNKALAAGAAAILTYTGGQGLQEGIEAQYDKERFERFERLKQHVNSTQNEKYEKERKRIIINSALRGATIGTAGAIFGHYLRGWMHGDEAITSPGATPAPWTPGTNHGLDVTIDKGQGMIHFAGQLKHAVAEKWGSDMSHAPESVKHIMNTSSSDLAKEFGGFKPGQINESAMLNKGATFHMDDGGNLTFKDPVTGESDVFEWGNNPAKGADYHGKMFDYKGSNANNIPQSAPGTPTQTGVNTTLDQSGRPAQVDPVTGKPMGNTGENTQNLDKLNTNKTAAVDSTQNNIQKPINTEAPQKPIEEATRTVTSSVQSGEHLHPGHPLVEKAFPAAEKVQGIPRNQITEVITRAINKDRGFPLDAQVMDTPDNAYKIWMYENFGKIEQTSVNTYTVKAPELNLDNMSLIHNAKGEITGNSNYELAIKTLEQKVKSATGHAISKNGISAGEYAKRLISELYKK
jgi:hypothetical protein